MDEGTGWPGVRERVVAVVQGERGGRGCGPDPLTVFEPALSEAEIREVEARYGTALPEEYWLARREARCGRPR